MTQNILLLAALLVAFTGVMCLNEPQTDNIAVQPLSEACLARQTNNATGKTCYNYDGTPELGPSPYPCPCLSDDQAGGCFPGTGEVESPNDYLENFQDYTIGENPPANYGTLSGMAFTDNTKEIFLVAKAGIVFRIDITTQAITTFYDFSDQVHDVGDYGGLSIEAHTDFANNPYVYVSYVNASLIGSNTEFNTVSFVRVMRLTTSNGIMTDKMFVIGQDHLDSNVLCSSSHAGGALAMGHDGSLFITLGEGSHFDTDVMDFGQNQTRYPYSGWCGYFFPGQAMGSMKAQSKDTLGGKLIRVDPATGNGICSGVGGSYTTYNPFCTSGINLRSPRARIWAMGFRNPFSMNLRPWVEGDPAPGVPYVGDVGLGSFEEVNAVTGPALNFGWPCWEGPLPMGGMRQTPMENLDFPDPTITRPINDEGKPFACGYVYDSVETQHPTYYWSRYTHQMEGLYGEQYVLGANFTGNCVSGVNFYSGTSYPSFFQNQVFFSDYGTQWIKSFSKDSSDKFVKEYEFLPLNIPVVDLEVNPNTGELCYIELLVGTVHCLKYVNGSEPPIVVASADVTSGPSPLLVTFSTDGTYDQHDNQVSFVSWIFGDNSEAVVDPNPSYLYTANGVYTATVHVRVGNFTVSSNVTITVGNPYVEAVMVLPVQGTTDSFAFALYDNQGSYDSTNNAAIGNDSVTFAANAVGGTPPYAYYWDVFMVHTNHYHPESYISHTPNFTITLDDMGAGSHIGERINFLVILTVTDAKNMTNKKYGRLSLDGWYSNPPHPYFVATQSASVPTGQFIRFDASASYDIDLDTITYLWDFGDGRTTGFNTQTNNRYISHAYSNPGVYTVMLITRDNWGKSANQTMQISVVDGYVQNPPSMGSDGLPLVDSQGNTFTTHSRANSATVASTTNPDYSSVRTTAALQNKGSATTVVASLMLTILAIFAM